MKKSKMKKSKMKKIEIIMHQHQDGFGHVFGSLHPINAEHKKVRTQKYHDLTISMSNTAGIAQR